MQKILVINPGSTSTKVAVFEDVKQLFSITIRHTDEELKHFTWVMDQLDFRTRRIEQAMLENGLDMQELTCIMSRGGMIPPCKSGAYRINDAMVQYMYDQKVDTHISERRVRNSVWFCQASEYSSLYI